MVELPSIALWFVEALLISAGASLFLNALPALPFFPKIPFSRIEARWTGFGSLTIAFAIWISLNLNYWPALVAWLTIMLGTLIPNTAFHLYHTNSYNPNSNGPRTPLTRRQQALIENAIAMHLDIAQATEVIGIMLKALGDPKYARDPDDPLQWRQKQPDDTA